MSDDKKEVKSEAPAPKPAVAHEAHAHGKKIGRMTLVEVNAAIEKCQKTMGGLWSSYGQSLVGHRQDLMAQQPKAAYRKAA